MGDFKHYPKRFGRKTLKKYLLELGYYQSKEYYIAKNDDTLKIRIDNTKQAINARKSFIHVKFNDLYLERIYFKPEDVITPQQLQEIILKQFDKVKTHYTETKK